MMTESREQDQQPVRENMKRTVVAKEQRKLHARRVGDRSVWFGLGMFGLVGWSVAVPALAGIALGMWLDTNWPSRISWKLTLLFVGVVTGFANAYRWMHRENEEE